MEGLYSGVKHKDKIIKLFRSLLRERLKLPTENRRQFVLHKVRTEFREGAKVVDPKKIRSLLIIGNTHLDTVMIQAKHLSSILEYEPTAIETKRLEKRNKMQGNDSHLNGESNDPNEQMTLKINTQHLQYVKEKELELERQLKRDSKEDNIR